MRTSRSSTLLATEHGRRTGLLRGAASSTATGVRERPASGARPAPKAPAPTTSSARTRRRRRSTSSSLAAAAWRLDRRAGRDRLRSIVNRVGPADRASTSSGNAPEPAIEAIARRFDVFGLRHQRDGEISRPLVRLGRRPGARRRLLRSCMRRRFWCWARSSAAPSCRRRRRASGGVTACDHVSSADVARDLRRAARRGRRRAARLRRPVAIARSSARQTFGCAPAACRPHGAGLADGRRDVGGRPSRRCATQTAALENGLERFFGTTGGRPSASATS